MYFNVQVKLTNSLEEEKKEKEKTSKREACFASSSQTVHKMNCPFVQLISILAPCLLRRKGGGEGGEGRWTVAQEETAAGR